MSKDYCDGDELNKLFSSCDAPCCNSAEGRVLCGMEKKNLEHIRAGKYKPTAMKVIFNSDYLPHNNQSWGFSLSNFEVEKGVILAF